MQLAPRCPCPGSPRPASGAHRWAGAVPRAAVVLLAVVAACYSCLPTADARGHRLALRPSASAYPLARERGLALDPWGFVARQCTSYAAWYLNTHRVPFGVRTRGPAGEGLFTSAGTWDRAAVAAGFAVRARPAVGSIAQWEPGESSPPPPSTRAGRDGARHHVLTAGRYGHVAVVRLVLADGSVLVSEYDGADRRFHVLVTRAPRYLYIGVSGTPAARSALAATPRSTRPPGQDAGG